MSDSSLKPVFFLAFANDRDESDDRVLFLRNLADEVRRLRQILEESKVKRLCQVVIRENATHNDILDVFLDPEYRHRIALFHYGGHANSYQLLLETADGKSAPAYASGLAEFLRQQRELAIVFLNGCSTEPQMQALLDAGISVVIATSQAIDDKVAVEFASCFYQSLASGSTVQHAYNEAVAAPKIPRGDQIRNFYAQKARIEVAERWPWVLRLRPGAEAMAQWNLPDHVGDPLFGLPDLPTLDLPSTPYRYLEWYRRQDAELFFGRGRTIRQLYNSITTGDSAPIILFHGQSGAGKSSLLDAGLLPRLEQSHRIVYLRRDATLGLLGTLTSSQSPLEVTVPRLGWADIETRTGKPLTVVLDQVEEYLLHPIGNPQAEIQELFTTIQETFGDQAQRPCGKLLLCFRKDWLAEIEKAIEEVQLPCNVIYLEQLDRKGIIEVILGPTRVPRLQDKYRLVVDDEVVEEIADDLRADLQSPIAPTLQILLTKFWEHVREQHGARKFTRELYHKLKDEGYGLQAFLEQQLDELHKVEPVAVDSGLSLDLLLFHTSEKNVTVQRNLSNILEVYSHQQATVERLINHCQTLRVLIEPVEPTEPADKPSSGKRTTRLVHDTLALLVRTRYEASDTPGKRARKILESRVLKGNNGSTEAVQEPLSPNDLRTVEIGQDGMRAWDAKEEQLVAISREHRAKLVRQAQQRLYAFVSLGVALILMLGLAIVLRIGELERDNDLAHAEAQRLATEYNNLLDEDPIEAAQRSLDLLPEPAPAAGRPFVPVAEFTLNHALRSNLEEEYLDLSAPPTNTDGLNISRVAFGDEHIAVGNNAIRLVPYDLATDKVNLLTDTLQGIRGVAWDRKQDGQEQDDQEQDALLAWNNDKAQVWLPDGHFFERAFEKADPLALITCAQWRPNAKQIAICLDDNLWLWSYETAEASRLYTAVNKLEEIQWSPQGNRLAIQDGSFVLLVWEETRMRQLQMPEGPAVHGFSWSPNAQRIAAIFKDGQAWVWPMQPSDKRFEVSVGGESQRYEYHIEFIDDDRFLTWIPGMESPVQLWVIGESGANKTFGVAFDTLHDARLSPDKKILLTLSQNGTIRGWEVDSGDHEFALIGHTRAILSAEWLDQTHYLATSSNDGTVRIWNTETEQELMTLRGHTAATIDVTARYFVHWHKDGRHVFTYGDDSTIRMWRIFDENGNPMCEGMDACYGFSQLLSGVENKISHAMWSDTDTILAVDGNEKVSRLQQDSLEDASWLSLPYTGKIVTWSPDGAWVFRQVEKQEGVMWKYDTGEVISVQGAISKAIWLEIGLLLDQGPGPVKLMRTDAESVSEQIIPIPHGVAISDAQVQDNLVAMAANQGGIWIWPHTGEAAPFNLVRGDDAGDNSAIVASLQWNATGTHLLSWDGTNYITLWDVGAQQVVKEWHNPSRAAFSPDGRYIAIAQQKSFFVYDIERDVTSSPVLAHDGLIQEIQWLEGTSWPNQDRLNAFASGLLRRYKGQSWNPPATRWLLLTWSNDNTIGVWQWGSIDNPAAAIAHLSTTSNIDSVAVNKDGSSLLTVHKKDGLLRVWRTWLHDPLALREDAESIIEHRTN